MADDHAVVIGASVAGLLAARAAADHFARVTVLDRDALPPEPAARRGVPQSRQLHVLLARGAELLEELFPGFRDELVAAGASVGDVQTRVAWYLDGYRMAAAASGVDGWGVSRRLIEHRIRARTAALSNVTIRPETEALDLLADAGRTRVTGVRVRAAAGDPYEIEADLVIDAAGRGSRALVWLAALGYPAPPESQVRADVVYVTRPYEYAPHLVGGLDGGVSTPFPGSPRGWALAQEENGRAVVCLVGLAGAEPPTDDAGMLAFAERIGGAEGAAYLRSGTPVGEAVKMRYPAGVRRHFEKAARLPAGHLVVGDALCSFDPIYGQGMTSAALQADALRRGLGGDPARLARTFYRAAATAVRTPWLLAAGGDLRFPEAEGRRSPAGGPLNRYLDRLRVAAATDPAVGRAFLRVAQLLDPPAKLMSPALVWRVFRAPRSVPRALPLRPAGEPR